MVFTTGGWRRRFGGMRTVIAALVVLGLAVGVFLMWPRPDDGAPISTEAAPTTITTSVTATNTLPPETAPSTEADSHVVETVEEAEMILRELWFGWFEGIYDQDEDRIREVVATEQMLAAGTRAFGTLPFNDLPTTTGMSFQELEILKATTECLVVWSVISPAFLDLEQPRSGVEVLRFFEGEWRFATAWRFREDLWEGDCESQLQPFSS